jgi:flagellum-specific peptidoglycan hydrolase FlgJ
MKLKPLTLYFIILLGFSSCLPRTAVLQNPTSQSSSGQSSSSRTTPTKGSSSTAQSRAGVGTSAAGLAYIDRFKQIAVQEMNQYGIPASIKLAQALLESGNGQSELALRSNNHFGIKCGIDWKGGKSYHDDDEAGECFRVYSRPEESFRDHSEFLLRKRYADLFKLPKDDYKGWAHGLKAAGYATNPRYAELLIDLIERYELHQYDRPESLAQQTQRAQSVQQAIVKHEVIEPETQTSKSRKAMLIHEVLEGETLNSIASKYGLSVDKIKQLNQLTSERIHIGQLLVVQ